MSLVDEGRIAFTPAVELSYLTRQEQQALMETIESGDCTPSLSQAIRMRKLSEAGKLDMDGIFNILAEVKGNQKEYIKLPSEKVRKHLDLLGGFEERLITCREQLENTKVQLASAKQEVEKSFPQEDELKTKSARLDELNILLNMDKRENEIVDGEPAEDAPTPERNGPDRER